MFPAPAERALYRVTGPFDFGLSGPAICRRRSAQRFPPTCWSNANHHLLAPDARVIYEHAAKRILPDIPGFRFVRQEVYGDVALAFFGTAKRDARAIYPGFVRPADDSRTSRHRGARRGQVF